VAQNVDFALEATRAVTVVQFTVGQHYWETGSYVGPTYFADLGDPAMVVESPVEQWRAAYAFLAPATFTRNVVNVVAPRGATVLLDDEPLRAQPVAVGDYEVYRVELVGRQGVHRVATTDARPFGLKVYGFGAFTSYMYPGGSDLQTLPPG
jgi:hypothetical protein